MKEEDKKRFVPQLTVLLPNVQCTVCSQRQGLSRGWCARQAVTFCGNWPRWVTRFSVPVYILIELCAFYLHLVSMLARSMIDKERKAND
jgi:hypothetical protein